MMCGGLGIGIGIALKPVRGRRVDPVVDPPTGVAAAALSSSSIRLTYTPPALAKVMWYRQRVTGNTSWGLWINAGRLDSPIDVTGLSAATAYDFQLAGGNESGRSSAFSGIVSATTQAAYDADAVAFWSHSAITPSDDWKAYYSQIVTALKASGIWATIDLCRWAKTHAQDIAGLDLKGGVGWTPVNGPAWAPATGFTTDGSTSYINSNVSGALTHYAQNNASWALALSNVPTSFARYIVGNLTSSPRLFLYFTSAMLLNGRLNGTSSFQPANTVTPPNTAIFFDRADASNVGYGIDTATLTSIAETSVGTPTDVTTYGRHAANYTACTMAADLFGGSLTQAQRQSWLDVLALQVPTT